MSRQRCRCTRRWILVVEEDKSSASASALVVDAPGKAAQSTIGPAFSIRGAWSCSDDGYSQNCPTCIIAVIIC